MKPWVSYSSVQAYANLNCLSVHSTVFFTSLGHCGLWMYSTLSTVQYSVLIEKNEVFLTKHVTDTGQPNIICLIQYKFCTKKGLFWCIDRCYKRRFKMLFNTVCKCTTYSICVYSILKTISHNPCKQ